MKTKSTRATSAKLKTASPKSRKVGTKAKSLTRTSKSSSLQLRKSGTAVKKTGSALKRAGGTVKKTAGALKRAGGTVKKTGSALKNTGGSLKRTTSSIRKTGSNQKIIRGKVKDIMFKSVLLMKPTDSVQNAAQKMNDKNNGCVLINENEKIYGVVTARDIVTRGVSKGKNLDALKLKDIMSPKILYCYEEDTVEQAAQSMAKNQVHRLPVLNKAKKLVGLLSLGHIALHSGGKTKKAAKAVKTTKTASKKRK